MSEVCCERTAGGEMWPCSIQIDAAAASISSLNRGPAKDLASPRLSPSRNEYSAAVRCHISLDSGIGMSLRTKYVAA